MWRRRSPVKAPVPLRVREPLLRVLPRPRVPERERVFARRSALVSALEREPPAVVRVEGLPPSARLWPRRRVP